MKKSIAAAVTTVSILALTGCNSLYTAIRTTQEKVHDLAVQKVSDYAETSLNRKIGESEDLTEVEKAKLKAEVAALKADILEKIAQIRTKTEEKKEETVEKKEETDGK